MGRGFLDPIKQSSKNSRIGVMSNKEKYWSINEETGKNGDLSAEEKSSSFLFNAPILLSID